MTVVAASEGTLDGRVELVSIEDPGPSLAFALVVPLNVRGEAMTLSVDLRHPGARGWRDLLRRDYVFDESTRRYGKSDGEDYAIDDVFAGTRSPAGYHETSVSRVVFGAGGPDDVAVEVEGTVHVDGEPIPFRVDARVRVGDVRIVDGPIEHAAKLVAGDDYAPARDDAGNVVLRPRR